MSKNFKILIITLFLFLIPLTSFSQDRTERAFITYKGTKGYFFSEKVGDLILADLERYKVQKEEVKTFELKIIRLQDKIDLLQFNLELTEKMVGQYKTVADTQATLAQRSEDKYTKLRDKERKWYRSPAFWLGVGMVVGGGMAVGLTFGLKEAKE